MLMLCLLHLLFIGRKEIIYPRLFVLVNDRLIIDNPVEFLPSLISHSNQTS